MKCFLILIFAVISAVQCNPDDHHEEFVKMWTDEQEEQAYDVFSQICKNITESKKESERVFEGGIKAFKCVLNEMKLENTQNQLERIFNKKIYDDVPEVCEKIEKSFGCIDDFRSFLPHCFDENDLESLDIIINLIKIMFRYVCENKGERFIKLFTEYDSNEIIDGKYNNCSEGILEMAYECYKEPYNTYAERISKGFENAHSMVKLELKLTKAECNAFIQQHECAETGLKELCDGFYIHDFIRDLFIIAKSEFKCSRFTINNDV